MIISKMQFYGAVSGAVLLAAAAGFGAAVFFNQVSPAATPDEQAEGAEAGPTPPAEGLVVISPAQIQAAAISIVQPTPGGGAEVRLSGRVQPMVDARASIGATVAGRVERVLVAAGQTVSAGQALVVLVSGDAASLRAEADAAQASYVAAEQAHGRDEELAKLGVIAGREAEVSHAQALSAQASARAARARAAVAGSPSGSGRVTVTSPIAGVVTNVQVGPGGFVTQAGLIAEVTNPARGELVFSAPPQLAAQVAPGARLRVTGPAGEFDAVITGVAADAGAQGSGAAIIRARAENAALPPAGSAVTGAIVTGRRDQDAGGLSIPSDAIQTVNGEPVVFVQAAGGFKATRVLVGRQAGGRVEILRGLDGSESIAAANAFLLKAELAKGEAEHGH